MNTRAERIRKRLVRLTTAAAFAVIAICSPQVVSADEQGMFQIDFPKNSTASIGYFYNSKTQSFVRPKVCFKQIDTTQTKETPFDSQFKREFQWAESATELNTLLGVSAYMQLAVKSGVDVKVDISADYSKDTHFTNSTKMAVGVYRKLDSPVSVLDLDKSPLMLTEDALQALLSGEDNFKKMCGDYVVMGIREGVNFVPQIKAWTRNYEENETFNLKVDAEVEAESVDFAIGVNIDTEKHLKESGFDRNISLDGSDGIIWKNADNEDAGVPCDTCISALYNSWGAADESPLVKRPLKVILVPISKYNEYSHGSKCRYVLSDGHER